MRIKTASNSSLQGQMQQATHDGILKGILICGKPHVALHCGPKLIMACSLSLIFCYVTTLLQVQSIVFHKHLDMVYLKVGFIFAFEPVIGIWNDLLLVVTSGKDDS